MKHWETHKRVIKPIVQKKSIISDRLSYKRLVWKLTNSSDLSSIENINKREFRKYDLDHKISIFYGFYNNIPAEHISHISNLRIISHLDNSNKGIDIHIDKDNEWIICKS